jgi:hypothetical protein
MILLLCLLAAIHVLVFSAAFPFFGVVDEQAQFDLVVRYSQADPPRTLTHISAGALPYIVYFGTPEYLSSPEQQPGGVFVTPWSMTPQNAVRRLAPQKQMWRDVVLNYEAAQPPLYYICAGGWWRLWQALGLTDGPLLYSLRFLNALILMAIVWLAGITALKLFPDNSFMQVAVPALAAFFPQSIFYAINNDVLSPLTSGVAFLLLLSFWEAEIPSRRLALATGLSLAAVFLTKLSNLPLLAVAGLFVALKLLSLQWHGRLRESLVSLVALLLSATLPLVAWTVWCQTNFGDPTGTAQKISFLHWTHKPPGEWLQHPLFTAPGFWIFLKGNLATLWQGELLWHRQPLANPAVDSTYAVLTLGALAFTLVALLRPRSSFSTPQRAAVTMAFLCFVAMFAFFALLSVKYDFQDCFYPSRAHPYFTSGRLMLGMFIPFLILFACGLDRLMNLFQNSTKYLLLLALLAFMLASEITIDLPVFASEFNWFHL